MSSAGQRAAEQAQEHVECPWCGGRARLEWREDANEIPCVAPACMVCGMSSVTALPIPNGEEVLEGLSSEEQDRIMAPAWEAWDNASWVRERVRMHKAGEKMRKLLTLETGLPTLEIEEWIDACRDNRRPW